MIYFFRAALAAFVLFALAAVPAQAQMDGRKYFPLHPSIPRAPGVESLPPPESVKPQSLPVVTFKKMDRPADLDKWIEVLAYGILTDVPPEYDYYGYEIRRYMRLVGTDEVYTDDAALAAAIENVKKAAAILDYWDEETGRRIDIIDKKLAEQNPPESVRSLYDYNKTAAEKFIVDCRAWIDANQLMLEYLEGIKGHYELKNDQIFFYSYGEVANFADYFQSREKSRAAINRYQPFAGMEY